MDEYLRLMEEYTRSVYNAISLEWMVMLALTTLIGGMAVYFHSQRYMDRAVSKRKMKAKHKREFELAMQTMTEALEAKHRQGHISREGVDMVYKMIVSNCPKLREIGINPTFGKPYYTKPGLYQSAAKVKSSIINRLKAKGMSIKEIWDAKGRMQNSRGKTAKQDMQDLVASIKRKPTV